MSDDTLTLKIGIDGGLKLEAEGPSAEVQAMFVDYIALVGRLIDQQSQQQASLAQLLALVKQSKEDTSH